MINNTPARSNSILGGILCLLTLCCSLSAQTGTYQAKRTNVPLTADGNLSESAWTDVTFVTANKLVLGASQNNTVTWAALWDTTHLYVGIKVLETSLFNDSAGVWLDDGIEIYIDANHNHGTVYDTYDRQFTLGYNDGTAFAERNNNIAGVIAGTVAITGGYTIEFKIPWTNFPAGINPIAGLTIGFDIGNNDDDNGGDTREAQVVWNGTIDDYHDTSAFGDLTLSATVAGAYDAKKTVAPIAIDGVLSESVWTLDRTATKVVLGTTQNNTVTWGSLWDDTHLYVAMKVVDGNLYNDSVGVWLDDGIEIYIDANHNKGTTYDSFDRQFTLGYRDGGSFGERNNNVGGVVAATAIITGGYTVEFKIPWSNLGITPATGVTIGFDVGSNDDDNGGDTRESQVVWWGTSNNYSNTSGFGDLKLSATTVGSSPSVKQLQAESANASSGTTVSGTYITSFNNGDWLKFSAVDLGNPGYLSFQAQVGSANTAANYGRIDVRLDSTTGTVIASLRVLNTGSVTTFETQTATVTGGTGVHDLYLVAVASAGVSVCNLDWIKLRRDILPRGATVPFVTYEAEDPDAVLGGGATLNGSTDQFYKFGASGRNYAWLTTTSHSVQWVAALPANHLTLRYGVPQNTTGTVNVVVTPAGGGTARTYAVPVAGKNCFDDSAVTTKPRRFDEVTTSVTVNAGDTVKVQKIAASPSTLAVDLIDLELAAGAGSLPAGFLSIAGYPMLTGETDDGPRMQRCFNAADTGGKKAFLPAGTYVLNTRVRIPPGVEVRGAGIFYTTVHNPQHNGPWADTGGFHMAASSKLSNLLVTQDCTNRAGGMMVIEPDTPGVTGAVIDNVMTKNVGVLVGWRDYTGWTIRNVRLIGNYYDGIHLGDGAAVNNLVENSFFRGAGDDNIAQVNRTDYPLASGNVAQFNTCVANYSGRGIANIGGNTFVVRDSLVEDAFAAGLIIATENLNPPAWVSYPIRGYKVQRVTVARAGHPSSVPGGASNHASLHFSLPANFIENVKIEDCIFHDGYTGGIAITNPNTSFGDSTGRTQFNYVTLYGIAGTVYSDLDPEVVPVGAGNSPAFP